MKTKQKTIKDLLDQCKPAISSHMPGADCVVLKTGRLYAFSGSFLVSLPFEHDLDVCVRFQDFLRVVSNYDTEELILEQTERGLRVKSGRNRTDLPHLETTLYARIMATLPADLEFSPLDPAYLPTLQCATYTDGNRDVRIRGLYMTEGSYLSTDTVVISRALAPLPHGTFWMREDEVEAIRSIPLTGICQREKWLYFRTDDERLFAVAGLNAEDFPGAKFTALLEQVMSSPAQCSGVIPEGFEESVKRISAFASDRYADLFFTPDALVLVGANQKGDAVEELPVQFGWTAGVGKLHMKASIPGIEFLLSHTRQVTVRQWGEKRYALTAETATWKGALNLIFDERG